MKHVDGKHKNVSIGENKNNDNFVWENKWPYNCKVIDGGLEFCPTKIDYDCEQVWRQIGQAEGSGEWYSFDAVIFKANKNFDGINCV